MVEIITLNKMSRGRWAAVAACAFIALGVGFVGGWFTAEFYQPMSPSPLWLRQEDPLLGERIRTQIKADNIKRNLRRLSRVPHLAGTRENLELAQYLRDLWIDQGLDSAGIDTYNVLLSYPGNASNTNKIEVINDVGGVYYSAPLLAEFDEEDTEDVDRYTPYVAFSEPGTVEADAVFAYHASEADFTLLKTNHSIDVRGKIVLACMSVQSTVRDMTLAAVKHGAVGLIVFPNPLETAPFGANHVFPENKWMSGATAKRDFVSLPIPGDVLTPGYPAKGYATRLELQDTSMKDVPSIPVQTVGYQVGLEIMRQFDDSTPAADHFGFGQEKSRFLGHEHPIPFTVRHGGKMKYGRKVRLTVNNRLERRDIHNTCGMIKGAVEPDRLVVVGNHRDAWVYGAIDPGGGTAVMMELVRILGKMNKNGWRPRRTLVFCSWDAEEFGLIGSMEWVEDKLPIIMHKAVAYINLDIVVMGRVMFMASASPLLDQLIFDSSRKVSHPHFPSLYEAWKNISLSKWHSQPGVELMAANSDHVSFLMHAGVPSVKALMRDEHWGYYLAYHTAMDSYQLVEKFVDPNFRYHQMMAEFHGEMLARLVDDVVLPLEVKEYATLMQTVLLSLEKLTMDKDSGISEFFKGQGKFLLSRLKQGIGNFSYAAGTFHMEKKSVDKTNPYAVREMNDKLVLLEKAFIDVNWRPADSVYRHVLFSPTKSYVNILKCFPGINDVLADQSVKEYMDTDKELPPQLYKMVEREFSVVLHALDRAADILVV